MLKKEMRPTTGPGISFPMWVLPPSPCFMRTNSVVVRGRHGAVRYYQRRIIIP